MQEDVNKLPGSSVHFSNSRCDINFATLLKSSRDVIRALW